jgi:hypothetical protein
MIGSVLRRLGGAVGGAVGAVGAVSGFGAGLRPLGGAPGAREGPAGGRASEASAGLPTGSFPPYRLIERDFLADAQAKYARLERLYHVGQKNAWDGHALLRSLIQKHGGIHIAPEKRAAIARIFSIILWGELAAWNISADLAEALENVEAKMAASGQVFDEARHFYTMRDYLLELGCEIPPLDAYTRAILIDVLETDSLVEKLIGMQLLVENVAVNLFRAVAKSRVEPVLSDLMPFFEQDEARHVGLGVLYLPALLRQLSRWEAARLQLFQVKVNVFIVWGTILLRDAFETVGVDLHDTFSHGVKNQLEVFASMGRFEGGLRGIYVPPAPLKAVNDWAIDYYFPKPGARVPSWLKAFHDVMERVAAGGERLLQWAA